MQIRHYLTILQRYWIVLVVLPLVVAVVSLLIEFSQPQRYVSTAHLMISQTPNPSTSTGTFPDVNLQYSWQSSQFILDDMPSVVSSRAFAEDVSQDISQRFRAQRLAIAPEMVQGGLSAQTFYRTVTLSSIAGNAEVAEAMLISAVETLQSRGLKYWNRMPESGNGLSIVVLNPPTQAAPINSTSGKLVAVVLRTVLALAAAAGLAFLLHYLDDTLREPHQVETVTGMPIIGVIPSDTQQKPAPPRPGIFKKESDAPHSAGSPSS